MGGPEDLEVLFDVFLDQVKAATASSDDITIKERLNQALRYSYSDNSDILTLPFSCLIMASIAVRTVYPV